MSLFEIKTHSTFENVHLIEADSRELAITRALGEDAPDFYQKHLDESVIDVSELVHGDPSDRDFDIASDSIHNRGYF